MTKPKSAPRGRKVGRPKQDDSQIYIAVEAVRRISGLSVRALCSDWQQKVVSQDRPLREWPIIGGESIRKRHAKMQSELFKEPERMDRAGAPLLLERVTALIDRQVEDYIAALGSDWAISVQAYGAAMRVSRSRQYRREGVRHV